MKIEFRWLETRRMLGVKDRSGQWLEQSGYEATRVLQFRTEADTGGCDIHLIDPWGPWQEVPVAVIYEN